MRYTKTARQNTKAAGSMIWKQSGGHNAITLCVLENITLSKFLTRKEMFKYKTHLQVKTINYTFISYSNYINLIHILNIEEHSLQHLN